MQVCLVKQSFSCVFQSSLEEQGNILLSKAKIKRLALLADSNTVLGMFWFHQVLNG